MGLHDGHRQRKKDQYLRRGLDSFADHEVLELILFYAIPRRDTNELAHTLLNRFGSLEKVFSASTEELQKTEGIGESAAILLKLLPEAVQRSRRTEPKERKLDTVGKCGNYFLQLLCEERQEVLYQLCLDSKGKLLSCKKLSQGDRISTALSLRQIVNNALTSGASGVVLGHNHPSGVALPSQEDLASTLRVRDALQTMNIKFLDHIIVADGDYVSMAQSGLLL